MFIVYNENIFDFTQIGFILNLSNEKLRFEQEITF